MISIQEFLLLSLLAGYFIRDLPFMQQLILEMRELHDPPLTEEAVKPETGAGSEEEDNEADASLNTSSTKNRGGNYLVYMVYSMLFVFLMAQSPNFTQVSKFASPAPSEHELLINDPFQEEHPQPLQADSMPSAADSLGKTDTDPRLNETTEELTRRLLVKYKHLMPPLDEGN